MRPYELEDNIARGIFSEYKELVSQFGFVVLFAAAVPLAPVLAVIVNLIDIRTDANKLLTSRRPRSTHVEGIGSWYSCFSTLTSVSIITNCSLILFTLGTGKTLTLTERFIVFVLAEHMIILFRVVANRAFDEVPQDVFMQKRMQQQMAEHWSNQPNDPLKLTHDELARFRSHYKLQE